MTDHEIRAKSLEIAVLIKKDVQVKGIALKDGRRILNDNFMLLAEAVEWYIRGDSESIQAESA